MTKIILNHLLYTHYQHENLQAAQKFKDFGLTPVREGNGKIYFRDFGRDPYVYIAEQSSDDHRHFIGGGWVVGSREDLITASQHSGATSIQSLDALGGGEFVDLPDPNGLNIRLIHGIEYRPLTEEQTKEIPKPVVFNTWEEKPLKGQFQRFDDGPSKGHKLGHYGLVVDKSCFNRTVAWYLSTFNLLETDSLFDTESKKNIMTYMHIDKGEEFTDHHSFFVQSPPYPVPTCSPHHSSFEVDNLDSQLPGHYHLASKGWTNCWGVGRHLLGSQIFDYWFDCSGNIVEHYSDGDLANHSTEVTREPVAQDIVAVWGPNVTLTFLTGKIEDIENK